MTVLDKLELDNMFIPNNPNRWHDFNYSWSEAELDF